MALTDAAIRKAKPADKPYKLSDERGLFLLIQPSGGKWWRYKYRIAGRERVLAIGIYPDVGLADARDRLAEARKLVAAGQDPSKIKKETKRQLAAQFEHSFEIIAREWHKKRLHTWSKEHGSKILKRLEANIFPKLGHRPISEITAAELLKELQKMEERGALDMTHRISQTCGQVFTYAVLTERLDRNPISDLRGALKPVVKTHRAYLKPEELPEFLRKLAQYDGHPQTALALKLVLQTFVRTLEIRGAHWTEINFEKAEWRVPAERMKMREVHIVPLSRQVLETLQALKKLNANSELIFPNIDRPFGSMSENTMLHALYRMGYRGRATVHGFRSTASTVLNEHGFNSDWIERQLAHGERDEVRAAYNYAQYLPERRKMMQWWADYLDAVEADKAAPPPL